MLSNHAHTTVNTFRTSASAHKNLYSQRFNLLLLLDMNLRASWCKSLLPANMLVLIYTDFYCRSLLHTSGDYSCVVPLSQLKNKLAYMSQHAPVCKWVGPGRRWDQNQMRRRAERRVCLFLQVLVCDFCFKLYEALNLSQHCSYLCSC